jgi:hypothetical protein
MMKHSKILGLLLFLAVMGEVNASPITENFNIIREEILCKSMMTYKEFLFLHGQAKNLRVGDTSVGYAKAKSVALQTIDTYLYMTAPWPKDVRDEEKRLAWLFYRERNPFSLKLQGVEVVHQYYNPQKKCYGVVLGISMHQLNAMTRIDEATLLEAVRKARQHIADVKAAHLKKEAKEKDVKKQEDDDLL